MRYYIDTEFHENSKQAKLFGLIPISEAIITIELISIGIVAEDGRTYYAQSNQFDIKAAWDNQWLRENVLKSIFNKSNPYNCPVDIQMQIGWNSFDFNNFKRRFKDSSKNLPTIKREILDFVGFDTKPDFYGYYCDYDWVIFCWLFGRMIDLPKHFPMYCKDVKQMIDRMPKHSVESFKNELPQNDGHYALSDAMWVKQAHEKLLSNPYNQY